MRLRRSDLTAPGVRRMRRGRGFGFVGPDGRPADPATRKRAQALVIPPAWTDVWVSPWPNGHIQAVGTDDAGRRQYIYHPSWVSSRDRAKHDRVAVLAARLPKARSEIEQRLGGRGLGRSRVGAVALRMLDAGLFRGGGEEYEREHGSQGVATLLRDHVRVRGDIVTFEFPAKSGVERSAQLRDAPLARAVSALRRSRGTGDRLLQYLDAGEWRPLGSVDVNADFKELVGADHTVKDLRTWAATVLAASAFAEAAQETGGSRTASAVEREVMTLVAAHLGNTPAVARRSYVDRRVVEEYTAGRTVAAALRRLSVADRRRLRNGELSGLRQRALLERAVRRLLR